MTCEMASPVRANNLGPPRVLVAGDQDRLGLFLQGGDGNPVQASFMGGPDGGVQAAQNISPRWAMAATRVLPQGLAPRPLVIADRNSVGELLNSSGAVVKILTSPL